jgi:hypothetical protein
MRARNLSVEPPWRFELQTYALRERSCGRWIPMTTVEGPGFAGLRPLGMLAKAGYRWTSCCPAVARDPDERASKSTDDRAGTRQTDGQVDPRACRVDARSVATAVGFRWSVGSKKSALSGRASRPPADTAGAVPGWLVVALLLLVFIWPIVSGGGLLELQHIR